MPAQRPLTHARLLDLIEYDPESGVLLRRVSRVISKIGAPAGTVAKDGRQKGYRLIGLDGWPYQAGRLAWFYVTGEWPPGKMQVDHINQRPDDNRWCNLRLVTNSQNQQNRPTQHNNALGRKGVSWNVRKGVWDVGARIEGRRVKYRRACLLDAVALRMRLEREHYTHLPTNLE